MSKSLLSCVVSFAILASAMAGPPSGGGSRPSSPPPSRPSFGGGSSSGVGSKPPSSSRPVFSSPSSSPSSGSSVGRRPVSSSSFDSAARSSQAKSESMASIRKAESPRPTYTTPSGQSKPVDPKKVESLRNSVDAGKFTTRAQRSETVYHVYHDRPPMAYHDPYGPLLMYMLLDRSSDERAAWAYHHKDSMDPARYEELLKRDAALESKIRALEANKVEKNPDHTLPGVDPDLQYSDEYVDAALNFEEDETEEGFRWSIVWWTLAFIVLGGGLVLIIILARAS